MVPEDSVERAPPSAQLTYADYLLLPDVSGTRLSKGAPSPATRHQRICSSPSSLVGTSVAVTVTVSWLGRRLLEQQLELEKRRAQVQIESRADDMAGRIRGKLAETSDRLGAWLSDPDTAPPSFGAAVALMLDECGVTVCPSSGLPFVALAPPPRAVDEPLVAAEFRGARTAWRSPPPGTWRWPDILTSAFRRGRLRLGGVLFLPQRAAD